MEQKDRQALERAVCGVICRNSGIKAREIAVELRLDRTLVNQILYSSPLLHELCYADRNYKWHGIVSQSRPHAGLQEFSGFYSSVEEFSALSESAWMEKMQEGCTNIGRSLNDTRGLLHSFRDCRAQMLQLFQDVRDMSGWEIGNWEVAFELRLKRARHVRIYADVLVITRDRVFSLEFKMKDKIEASEVQQAAKYVPFLEILFGSGYEIIPALVLTGTRDLFQFVPIGEQDLVLPVCSGDMLFNVFDEYLGFLNR